MAKMRQTFIKSPQMMLLALAGVWWTGILVLVGIIAHAFLGTGTPGGTAYFLLLFIQPFLGGGVLFVLGGLAMLVRSRQLGRLQANSALSAAVTIPTWGRLDVDPRRGQWRVVRSALACRVGRMIVGAPIGYTAASFASLFVVLMAMDIDLDQIDSVLGATAGICAGVAALAGAIGLLRTPPRSTVEFDNRLLRVETACGDREIALADVIGWSVEDHRHRGLKSPRDYNYTNLLVAWTANGQAFPIHLFPVGNQGRTIAQRTVELLASRTSTPAGPGDDIPLDRGSLPDTAKAAGRVR
ncbi:MAG: hypothetical protein ACYS8X_08940 [Planctomycetota bacterium]|jgi:hypothetical protein